MTMSSSLSITTGVTFDEGVSFDVLRETQHCPPVVSTGNLNITDQSDNHDVGRGHLKTWTLDVTN